MLACLKCNFKQETLPPEAGPALRSVHTPQASLRCDRIHGKRLPAQLPSAKARETWQRHAAEHVPGCVRRDGVPGKK